MAVRIGELLLKEKKITPTQLQEALGYQKANGGKLAMNLVKLGFVRDDEITALLSRQYGVPSIDLGRFEIDAAVLKLIPPETAQKYQVVPLSRAGATLTLAMTDPTNVFAMDDIKFMTGYNVEPVVASEQAVADTIQKSYAAPTRTPTISNTLELANRALEDAQQRSTPLATPSRCWRTSRRSTSRRSRPAEGRPRHPHGEHDARGGAAEGRQRHPHRAVRARVRVRYRVDGVLHDVMHRRQASATADHLAPEDHGQAGHRRAAPAAGRPHQDRSSRQGREIDLRVSHLPTHLRREGGHADARQGARVLDLTRARLRAGAPREDPGAIRTPHGMVLVTGPTGRGKTTTLYAALHAARTRSRSTSSPSKTRSSTRSPASTRCKVNERHRPDLRRGAARPSCARTRHHHGR